MRSTQQHTKEKQMQSRRTFLAALLVSSVSATVAAPVAHARSRGDLEAAADATLARLKASEPVTDRMIESAAGVLIFPRIIRAGLLLGAAVGDGVLRAKGETLGVYRSTAASIGMQAGVSEYGYVMFLMDKAALDFVSETRGWEIGVGPNVTIADEGVARRLSSTTVQSGVYVFFVDQQGLFAGAGLEGSKISRVAD